MTPQTLLDLAQVERELEAWRERRAALDAEFDGIRARREEAIAARFAELSDELILTDGEVRRWALENESYESGSYQRMHELAETSRPKEIHVGNRDGREGYSHLLRPTVVLEQDSDTAAVAQAMKDWAEVWLMGREDLLIDVLEWSLSRSGSYWIVWLPEVDVAELHHTYAGLICSGDLHTVLAYSAEHHPYNHGRDMDDEEDY